MTWALTSYIIAGAIMTPLTGWLADRFGRKPLFLFSVIGFTIASALCGMAQSLPQVVTFRLLQGLCGASLFRCPKRCFSISTQRRRLAERWRFGAWV